MNRVVWFALLLVLGIASFSPAAVIITADAGIDTPGLPGFKTYQVSATSDTGGIVAVDFVGDGSTSGPNAKGFFGTMNQLTLFGGAVSTVFADNNVILDGQPNWNRKQDSQFAVNTSAVVVPPGLAKESATSLQAAWAWPEVQGLTVPIAQLVVPNSPSRQPITFNGAITVFQGGVYVDVPVASLSFEMPPIVNDLNFSTTLVGQEVELTPIDSAPGTPPVVWSVLSGPTYTPDFGAPSNAPGLGTATWSWDPVTQKFNFNTLGASRGRYVWTGSASGIGGLDEFSLTVNVTVPEPGTLLSGAIFAVVSILARRSKFWN